MAAGTSTPPPARGPDPAPVTALADAAVPALTLRDVVKTFDDVVAVDSVSLEVRPGEFVTLLGPSGCGKTTTLRMIAGFVEPDAGEIRIGAADVTRLPPNKRDIGMVFQSYGLFPHMTVADNVAYGLRMRRVPTAERRPAGRGGAGAGPAARPGQAIPPPAERRAAAARRARAGDRDPALRSCCSTSRCPISTPSSGRRCAGSSGAFSGSWTSPRCS